MGGAIIITSPNVDINTKGGQGTYEDVLIGVENYNKVATATEQLIKINGSTNIQVELDPQSGGVAKGLLGSRSTTNFVGKAKITVKGGHYEIYGIDLQSTPGNEVDSLITFEDDAEINASGIGKVMAVRPSGGGTITFNGLNNLISASSSESEVYGIQTLYGAQTIVNGNIKVDVTSKATNSNIGAYGIRAANYWGGGDLYYNSGYVEINGHAKVEVKSTSADAYGVFASALTEKPNQEETDGNIKVASLDVLAQSKESNAYAVVSKGENAQIDILNNALIKVDSEKEAFAVLAEEASTISIGSVEESSRDGVIQIFGNIKTDETSNISIGNGSNEVLISGAITDGSKAGITLNLSDNSVWHVTGDSTLGTLLGMGKVRLAAERDSETGLVNLASTLTIEQIQEGRLNLGFDGITADHINADRLAELVNSDGITVSADVDVVATVDEGGVFGELVYDSTTGATHQKANTMLSAFSGVNVTHLLQWRHEMSDLTKRMGELRMSPEGVGTWARVYGSEQEYGAQSVETKNASVQVGADYDIGSGWKVGGSFSYTDSTSTMDNGDADGDMYGLAVYGSWFKGDGQFLDLIAKYSRLSSDFTAGDMSGSYDNNAFSVSAEYGWHWKLSKLSFVEPQVEVTYGRILGDDFRASNGVKVSQDDTDSLVGRVGVRGGFYFPNNRGTIYAHVHKVSI